MLPYPDEVAGQLSAPESPNYQLRRQRAMEICTRSQGFMRPCSIINEISSQR